MKTIKIRDFSELPTDFTGVVEYTSGTKVWRLKGKYHREDGPAIEDADGLKQWYLNNERHRVDGPAYERADGSKEWWLNNNFIYELKSLGDYILIEEGLPSEVEWLGQQVTQRKVLTVKGIMYIPNLPGI